MPNINIIREEFIFGLNYHVIGSYDYKGGCQRNKWDAIYSPIQVMKFSVNKFRWPHSKRQKEREYSLAPTCPEISCPITCPLRPDGNDRLSKSANRLLISAGGAGSRPHVGCRIGNTAFLDTENVRTFLRY